MLAVSCDHVITTLAGRRRAGALAAGLPKGAWQRVSYAGGTSTTPATGHDGDTRARNAPDIATTSDNDSKITNCGWSTNRPGLRMACEMVKIVTEMTV